MSIINQSIRDEALKELKKYQPVEKKDRAKMLEGMASAQMDTLKILEKQMKGKSGDELAMLQSVVAQVTVSMLNYKDQVDLEMQKKMQAQALISDQDLGRESRKVEERSKEASNPRREHAISKAVTEINKYAELGFESDVYLVQIDRSLVVKVEAKMPKEFKGQDPTKLSTSELNAAQEAKMGEKTGTKSEHKVLGKYTAEVVCHEGDKEQGNKEQGGGGAQL